jgi:hypothetical protein
MSVNKYFFAFIVIVIFNSYAQIDPFKPIEIAIDTNGNKFYCQGNKHISRNEVLDFLRTRSECKTSLDEYDKYKSKNKNKHDAFNVIASLPFGQVYIPTSSISNNKLANNYLDLAIDCFNRRLKEIEEIRKKNLEDSINIDSTK